MLTAVVNFLPKLPSALKFAQDDFLNLLELHAPKKRSSENPWLCQNERANVNVFGFSSSFGAHSKVSAMLFDP